MAKKFILTGILAIALVFGMSVVGCDVDDDKADSALNGTWIYSSGSTVAEYKFDGGNYEFSGNGNPIQKGTFVTQENEIIITPTHYYGTYFTFTQLESKWYKKDELKGLPKFDDASLNDYYSVKRGTYSVNGNTLTIGIYGGGGGTFTKK